MRLGVFKKFQNGNSNNYDYYISFEYFRKDRISQLKPEWINYFSRIDIFYCLETAKNLRKIIKEINFLLKSNGEIIIHSTHSKIGLNLNHGNFFRSKSQIKSEFQLSTFGNYNLIFESHNGIKSKFIYKKKKINLENDGSINSWSFGVITNGKKNDQVDDFIKSIEKQNIPEYEIIVCGKYNSKSESVKVIPDVLSHDIRAPINTKKNNIIKKCSFQNIGIFHDRFILPDDWFEKMKEYGNNFEILQIPNLNTSGERVNDWPTFKNTDGIQYKINGGLSYNKYSRDIYIPGGSFIGKKWIFEKHPLKNKLHWDELEDVIFSKELILNGIYFYFDTNNSLITNSDRLGSKKIKSSIVSTVADTLRWIFANFYNRIIYFINTRSKL